MPQLVRFLAPGVYTRKLALVNNEVRGIGGWRDYSMPVTWKVRAGVFAETIEVLNDRESLDWKNLGFSDLMGFTGVWREFGDLVY